MTIKKFKEGEKIWERKFFANRDPAYAFNRMVNRLYVLGFFFESGYDCKLDAFWIIVGTGDNCLRFEP
jgi:hypothetical protein